MSEISGGMTGGAGSAPQTSGVPSVGQGESADSYGYDAGASSGGESQVSTPRVNLDELEDFKQWKSKMDKQVAERDRRIQAEAQAYQRQQMQMQQEMARLQEQLDQTALQGMDEYGQLEYKLRKEQMTRQQLERMLQQQQEERQRYDFFAQLRDRYGVDPEQVNADHPMKAITSVADWQHQQMQQLRAENERLRKIADARSNALDDSADLGNGSPVNPQTDIQRQFNTAMIKKDGVTADRLSRMAAQNGIQLDRMAWRTQQS